MCPPLCVFVCAWKLEWPPFCEWESERLCLRVNELSPPFWGSESACALPSRLREWEWVCFALQSQIVRVRLLPPSLLMWVCWWVCSSLHACEYVCDYVLDSLCARMWVVVPSTHSWCLTRKAYCGDVMVTRPTLDGMHDSSWSTMDNLYRDRQWIVCIVIDNWSSSSSLSSSSSSSLQHHCIIIIIIVSGKKEPNENRKM